MTAVVCNGATLWSALQPYIIPAPDVRAALGLVTADPGTVGIVYRTDQIAFANRVRVLAELRDGPEAKYSSAVITTAPNRSAATAFNEYLAGDRARRRFETHGFMIPGGAAHE